MNENERKYRELNLLPRRWFRLPTIDGYVLREFLIKFCVLLLVFIILFVLSDVFNELSDFLDADARLYDIVMFLLLRLPGNLRFVLPIAMLLGCMWTMATFGKNMEVTAMRASGVSLFRCGWAIFGMGLLATGVNIYFNEALVPYTEREAQAIVDEAVRSRRRPDKLLLTYKSPDRRRSWFFRSFVNGNAQNEVMVKFYRPDGTLEFDLSARRAIWRKNEGWRFEQATLTGYSADGVMPKIPRQQEAVRFPLSRVPETPDDILNTIKDEEELPTWVIWNLVRKTPNMVESMKSVYMTVFYYRLAFPWACFLAVFLGIPLATKNERSGSLMAIISAVLIIVIYIVIAQIFLVLGKREILPPLIAGLAPTLAFIAYGFCKVFYNRS